MSNANCRRGFPDSSKNYSAFEYLQIGSDELTWIRNLSATYRRVRLKSPFIPANYIPIMEDGMGGNYFVAGKGVDLPKPDASESVYYNPGDTPDRLEHVGTSFYNFLMNRIEMQQSLI